MRKQLTLLFGTLLVLQPTNAQDTAADSILRLSHARSLQVYQQLLRGQSRLYTGIGHRGYAYTIKGHAYLLTNEWQKGQVVYEGMLYDQVSLLYDIAADRLVVLHPDEPFRIEPIPDRVVSFTLNNRTFVYLHEDSLHRPPMGVGFYEMIGNLGIIAKKRKIIDQIVSSEGIVQTFVNKAFYFARIEGMYRPIRREADLLELFADRKKEVRRYLRKQKLRFKKNPEQTIIAAAAHYHFLKV